MQSLSNLVNRSINIKRVYKSFTNYTYISYTFFKNKVEINKKR